MLSLSTARKLKELGFAQEPKIDISGIDGDFYGGFYFIAPPEGCGANVFFNEVELKEYKEKFPNYIVIKIPTLEELIEACGLSFKVLELQIYHPLKDGESHANREDIWIAKNYQGDGNDCDMTCIYGEGKSPIEAVAALWSALNSK